MKTKLKHKVILKKNRKSKDKLKIKDETKSNKTWNTLSDTEKLSIICQLF